MEADKEKEVNGKEAPSPKKKRSTHRVVRVLRWVVLSLLLLIILLFVLLYTPPVQRIILRKVLQEVNASGDMKIEVGKFRLGFPLSLKLEEVSVVKPTGDTLVGVGSLQTTLSPFSLLNSRIESHQLQLERVRVFIPSEDSTSVISASSEALALGPLSVDLQKQRVDVGSLSYREGFFKYFARESSDSTQSNPVKWKIDVNRILLDSVRFDLEMPDGDLYVRADMQEAQVEVFSIDLANTLITSKRIKVNSGETYYSNDLTAAPTDRVNFSDLHAKSLQVEIADFEQQGSRLSGDFISLSMDERSGASLDRFRGRLKMEDGVLEVKDIALRTPGSNLVGRIKIPFALFSGDTTHVAELLLEGTLSDEDLYYFAGQRTSDLLGPIPKGLFSIDVDAFGNFDLMEINRLKLQRKGLVNLDLKGKASQLTSPRKRNAQVSLEALLQPHVAQIISTYVPSLQQRVAIPGNTKLKVKANLAGQAYTADASLAAPHSGQLNIRGHYAAHRQHYSASVQAHRFNVLDFLPQDSIGVADLSLSAEGTGFDFLSGRSKASLKGEVTELWYKGNRIEKIKLDGLMDHEDLSLALQSGMNWAQADLLLSGTLQNGLLKASLSGQIDSLSLSQLGVTQDTLSLRTDLHVDVESDFKQHHALSWQSDSLQYYMQGLPPRSFPLSLTAGLDSTSGRVALFSDDLKLNAHIAEPLDSLIQKVSSVGQIAGGLLSDTTGNNQMTAIAHAMPFAEVHFEMGENNPVTPFLRDERMYVERVQLDFVNRPQERMHLKATALNFRQDTTRIDSVGLLLVSKEVTPEDRLTESVQQAATYFKWPGTKPLSPAFEQADNGTPILLKLKASVQKSSYRGQHPFNIDVEASTDLNSVDLAAQYREKGQTSYSLAALAFRNEQGFGLSFKPQPVIVSGIKLLPNAQNALFYNPKEQTLKADLQLTEEKGGQLIMKSEESTESGHDQIKLMIQKLQLGILENALGLEGLGGLSFVDVRLERDSNTQLPRAVGDVSVNDLTYNHEPLGNVSVALFYEPHDKTKHYISAYLSHNGEPALEVEGRYDTADEHSPIKASAHVNKFPLDLANPFLGADLASLYGSMEGDIQATGTPKYMRLNGALNLKDAAVHLPQVGETFSIDTEPLRFENSKLHLKNFCLRNSDKHTPISVNGDFTLFGPEAMQANLRVDGDEVELIDSKQSRGQMVYGRLITSPHITLRGNVSKPVIRGSLNILGGTNLTYVYAGSALKATDNMVGVVVFKDFSDTLFVEEPAVALPSPGSADIALNIHIDPAVQLGVDLSVGHQDYVQVIGGGDLRFQSPPFGVMNLTGRYNLSGGGQVRYKFPVVGRKDFVIDKGSYVAWNGPIDNPYINFKAVNRVRADVNEAGTSRKVDFDVLIVAREDLSKIDLAFDLEAPDDLGVQNTLATMSKEERGKQAMALMVSGAFLATDPSEMSMQRILSGFAVSELNNLTGKFLEGTDLNVGMELHNTGSGSVYTDYTYSFSRRFFNDRVRFVIGGKVAAGNLPTNYEQTFIDNVTLEYRIDKSGSQYMSLFHKRNNDNILEGLVTETGASYILRRSLYKLSDLFRPQRRKIKSAPIDSLSTTPIAVPPVDTLNREETPIDSLTTNIPK